MAQVAKRYGVSEQTIYIWRERFGKLEAVDVKRLRQLEQENAKLKKLVAERDLPGARRRIGDTFERDDEGRVVLDDIRIVELYACPTAGPADLLHVLFGLRGAAGYRSEIWRLRRADEVWRADAVALSDPTAAKILELSHAPFDGVLGCNKVY